MRAADIDGLIARIAANEAEALAILIAASQGELRVLVAAHAASTTMVDQVLNAAWEEAYPRLSTAPSNGFLPWFWGIAGEILSRVLADRDRAATAGKDPLEHALVRAGLDGLDQDFAARIAALTTFKHGVEALEAPALRLIRRRYADGVLLEALASELGQNQTTIAASLFRARASARGQLADAESLCATDPLFPGLIEDYLAGSLIPDARQLLAGSVVKDLHYLAAFEGQARCDLLLSAMYAPSALAAARVLADALMPSLRTSQRLRAQRRPISDRNPRISDRKPAISARQAPAGSGTGIHRRSASGREAVPGTGIHRRNEEVGSSGATFTIIGIGALVLALVVGAIAFSGGAAPAARAPVEPPRQSVSPTTSPAPGQVAAPRTVVETPTPTPGLAAPRDPPSPVPAPVVIDGPPRPRLATPAALTSGSAVDLAVAIDGGAARVEWLVDGVVVGSDDHAPFSVAWIPTRAGSARLQARATDTAGRSGLSEVVLISIAARAVEDPVIALLEPADGSAFTAPAAINLAARFDGGQPDRVEFLNGEATVGEDTTAPFTATWNRVGAGTYQVRARARMRDRIVMSPAVTVVVTAPASLPPTVRIESPEDFETVSDSVKTTVRVRAADKDGVVSRVELFVDGTRIGEDTATPFNFTWSKPAFGEHLLTAVAFDDRGGRGESTPVAVLVGQKTMTSLVRAVSFAPERTEIEGWSFLKLDEALADGLNLGNGTVVGVAKPPAGDLDAGGRALFARALTNEREPLRFAQALPDGCYQVYAWVGDLGDGGGAFDLELEGVKVGTVGKLPKVGWARCGPFNATVRDGWLNAVATRRGGAPRLSGLAIFGVMRNARPPTPEAGHRYRRWNFGGDLGELRRLASYPSRPDEEGVFDDMWWPDAPKDACFRQQAWFVPSQTGNHQFAATADDQVELWLSPDETPTRLARIAVCANPSGNDDFDRAPEQRSGEILLVAGRRYFIQTLFRASGGPNHYNLRVRMPDGTLVAPLAKTHLLRPVAGVADLVRLAEADERLRATAAPTGVNVPPGAPAAGKGGLIYDRYDVALPGTAHLAIRMAGGLKPSSSQRLSRFESMHDQAEPFTSRTTGLLLPPETGDYVFWFAADDVGQLFLGEDDTPERKRLIASAEDPPPQLSWLDQSPQRSAPIHLEAGKQYFIEALQRDEGGSDYVAVGWQLPSGERERPIPAGRFAGAIETCIHPNGVTASSTVDSRPESMIDGAGLSQVGGAWVHTNEKYANGGSMWHSAYEAAGAVGQVNVTFDLITNHQITGLHIWNYNEKDWHHRGAKDIEVSTSVDGSTFVKSGSFTLKRASGQSGEIAQAIRLSTATTARYVKILVLSNFGSETPAGFSEVAILVTDPVASDKVLK